MERIEPTRALALKVWWAFMWRAVVFALLAGFVIGIAFGLFSAVFGLKPETIGGFAGLLGLVLGIGVSIEVMFRVLRKKFDGFELALLKSE
ncbi:MAG: hypothetical protein WC969_13240 [Elusimicrobiota bacterium]|jgi:hypothetical protein